MKAVAFRTSLLSGVLALSVAPFAQAASAANQSAVNNVVTYLESKQVADGHIGASAGETGWSAVALSAAGVKLNAVKLTGGTDLRAYLAANPPAATAAATDWERTILAITADKQNPYTFGGTDYVAKLKTFASAHQLGSDKASNDDIFGLLALLAARADISDPVVTDELAYILAHQKADGGFSYSTDATVGSDTNDAAAAIMALRSAQTAGLGSPAVTTAIANAKAYLLGTQNTDGGFPYDPLTPAEWGGPVSDVSSTSWVVMALNALGDADSTAGASAQKYIRDAQFTDGSFPYQAPAAGDVMNSAPAVTALAGSQYPVRIFAGTLPGAGEATPTPTATPVATASPTPSPTATPGAVLGAATTPTPSPSPAVLGASTLPAVGEVSNVALLEIALALAVMAGLGIYGLQRRRATVAVTNKQ